MYTQVVGAAQLLHFSNRPFSKSEMIGESGATWDTVFFFILAYCKK